MADPANRRPGRPDPSRPDPSRPDPNRPDPGREDLTTWPTGRLLSTAARLVEHAWFDRLAEHGLSHAGLMVLHELAERPLSQRELSQRCQVTEQTMSRTLVRLERAGHVRRGRDPRDRRRTVVDRTPGGTETWRLIVHSDAAERDILTAVVDPTDLREDLIQIVEALGDRPDRAPEHLPPPA
jgi:MarR family transcriptional regulator, organic hydroperoxide resistance regulator